MNGKASRAAEYYRAIINHENPPQFLADLVTAQKPENDFLEFKGASRIADREAKGHWSQALSGFANTEGGVLVWGIRAARVPDPLDPGKSIDGATDLDLVPNPAAFTQMLKDVRPEATIDPVPGVEFAHYPAGPGRADGFVICLIPESERKPHLAQIHPEKQYFQRIGDRFTVIPHSLLRSLFYPRTRAAFRALAKLSWRLADQPVPGGRHVAHMHLAVDLINDGTASAKDIFVLMKTRIEGQLQAIPPTTFNHLWALYLQDDHLHLQAHRPMHRGQRTPLFNIKWDVEARASAATNHTIVPQCPAPSCELTISCENHEQQVIKTEFDTAEMMQNLECRREATATE